MDEKTLNLMNEIAADEDTFLELKEVVFRGNKILFGGVDRTAASEIAEVFCSMANTEGGAVMMGVSDNRQIIGIPEDKKELVEQFVINVGLNNCKPMIEPLLDWVTLPDAEDVPKVCLKVTIPKARYYVHQTADGRFLKRIGSHRHPIPAEQLGRLLAARNLLIAFEERPALGSSLASIDRARFEEYYLRRFKRPLSSESSSFERLLANLKLATNLENEFVPSNLGLLLFAERPEEYLNGAYIDIAAYKGEFPDGETSDSRRITGPLPEQIVQLIHYFQQSPLISTVSKKGPAGRKESSRYALTALQEAVVNAIVHRDYELTGSQVIVRLFADRVEIQSPGGLHNTLSPEDLYAGCHPIRRNQLLAGFMRDFISPLTETSFMEARGEGFLNLVRDSVALGARRPKLEQIGSGIKLTIFAAENR